MGQWPEDDSPSPLRHWRRRAAKALPRTLRGRFLLIMIVGVLGAQLASYAWWSAQERDEQHARLDDMSRNLAYSVASTVRFFRSLPQAYRHVALDQLRDMGGTRFFVSINDHRLAVDDLGDGPEKALVVDNLRRVLKRELGLSEVEVEFSRPETLRLLNAEVLLTEMPPRWGQHSLLSASFDQPIVVLQLALDESQWLYVATLIPMPGVLRPAHWLLAGDRLFVLLVVLATVMGLSGLGIRSATRTLGRLAAAARRLGEDLDAPPLGENGPQEVATAAAAFNRMQRRLQHQVEERERLFSAISHDLKTPITRLRLRAEMLDDAHQRERFTASLDELDCLVRGALESVKGLDMHERVALLSPRTMLDDLAEELDLHGGKIEVQGQADPCWVKPLAFKRALSNLLENAIFYGSEVTVSLADKEGRLWVRLIDRGPGIPADQRDRVFEPFVRLEPSRSRHTGGSGLGLGIARHIIVSHGGSLTLGEAAGGGLDVTLSLPRPGPFAEQDRGIANHLATRPSATAVGDKTL
ncbi:ATP-binding protein [Halomonas sp. V046]|uniref:ATP-binding protein n=1 Tax=Halomonas sp. V046 TaxID=3459611 RepID=UPI004044FABD